MRLFGFIESLTKQWAFQRDPGVRSGRGSLYRKNVGYLKQTSWN
jgi:hypothetical protein